MHGSHKAMHLTTICGEVLGLRGTARNVRASKVVSTPDDTVVRSARAALCCDGAEEDRVR